MLSAVDQITDLASEQSSPVILWRYKSQSDENKSPHASSLPLGAHAVMTAWAYDAITSVGIDCSIEWAE